MQRQRNREIMLAHLNFISFDTFHNFFELLQILQHIRRRTFCSLEIIEDRIEQIDFFFKIQPRILHGVVHGVKLLGFSVSRRYLKQITNQREDDITMQAETNPIRPATIAAPDL